MHATSLHHKPNFPRKLYGLSLNSKAGFPLVDFFAKKGLFLRLIHNITLYHLFSRIRGEKKVETLSTLEKRKKSLTYHSANMIQRNMVLFKQTHENGNNSYNKPFTILSKSKIISRETPGSFIIN